MGNYLKSVGSRLVNGPVVNLTAIPLVPVLLFPFATLFIDYEPVTYI